MKNKYFLQFTLLILVMLLVSLDTHSKFLNKSEENDQKNDIVTTKFAALAIDRGNGIYFGWSSDCLSLAEAEKKAIDVCKAKGGDCTIVLSFSGTGCAAYRFITGTVGMGYGWGLAVTKEEADKKAVKECAERSFGLPAPNVIFNCNSPNSGELKEIYDAHDEINAIHPSLITDY